MSKITIEKTKLQHGNLEYRCMGHIQNIQDLAQTLETQDLNLVAHLLIIDQLDKLRKSHFTGVEVTRAGEGKKLKQKQ